ncbi:hypothetical protein K438DRAFT_920471 [Mycena galopus ATCC 62051]|nr:hypothetical protein K438DRAFT_920471 [Mycena galopus ATCC 62051]
MYPTSLCGYDMDVPSSDSLTAPETGLAPRLNVSTRASCTPCGYPLPPRRFARTSACRHTPAHAASTHVSALRPRSRLVRFSLRGRGASEGRRRRPSRCTREQIRERGGPISLLVNWVSTRPTSFNRTHPILAASPGPPHARTCTRTPPLRTSPSPSPLPAATRALLARIYCRPCEDAAPHRVRSPPGSGLESSGRAASILPRTSPSTSPPPSPFNQTLALRGYARARRHL